MAVTKTLLMDNEDQMLLIEILNDIMPNNEVWLYGSRIKGTARPNSDLDMIVFATSQQSLEIEDLKEAFDESDLPFRVDLFTWEELPKSFHNNIKADHFVLQRENTANLHTDPNQN